MEQQTKNRKTRGFCFTLNNYREGQIEKIRGFADQCDYLIFGREVGENGTPHLQGYLHFKNPRSWNSIRKWMTNWHLEPAVSTPLKNFEYCSKDGDFEEFGTRPVGERKRTDLDEVKEMVKKGKPMREIVEVVSSYQSFRFAEGLYKYMEKGRNWEPEVYWFYGPTGTGKTRKAFEMAPDAWVSARDGKWWEGYDAHEDVILDDFRGDFCKFHELLRILDRYPYRIEFKGGSRQLLAKRIFVTSCYHPSEVYKYATEEKMDQLLRRIKVLMKFSVGKDGTIDTEQQTAVILGRCLSDLDARGDKDDEGCTSTLGGV